MTRAAPATHSQGGPVVDAFEPALEAEQKWGRK
jgi:hypothetical protein